MSFYDNEIINPIVTRRHAPFTPLTPYPCGSDALSEIAKQDSDGALSFLRSEKRFEREELRIKSKTAIQTTLSNGQVRLGEAFITHRYPGEQNCNISFDNSVKDGISDGFFGGSNDFRVKGNLSIHIY